MTAEVALLNSTAVALAADSAMTLGTGKVYPANKLFALSKHHPVGVMVYNNAELMRVPWETIIKMYRRSIGRTTKGSCREYLTDLFEYASNSPICADDQRVANLTRIASATYGRVVAEVEDQLAKLFEDKRRISSRDEGRAIRNAIEKQLTKLRDSNESSSMQGVDTARLVRDHEGEIDACIDAAFHRYYVSKVARRLLHRILALSVKGTQPLGGYSGVVVAGFGEGEMFPSLVEATTDGMLPGTTKFQIWKEVDIGRSGTFASIIPFAQREMVTRFMEGVDPDFLRYLEFYTPNLLYKFGEELLEALDLAEQNILEVIQNVATNHTEEYFRGAKNFREKNFVNPIMEIVTHLPKDELANMAEALVNLTSIKRRVSLEQETVGGPVDIAVISKGDGFVWIKRKHYFDRDLNPSYFHRQSAAKLEDNDDEA